VTFVGREGDKSSIEKDRRNDRHVRQVGTASAVGIIGDVDVSLLEVFGAELVQHTARPEVERAQEEGDSVALGNEVSLRIGEAHRIVEDLVDDGAHAGSLHRDEHLIADGHKAFLDDLQGEGIDCLLCLSHLRISPGYACFSMCRKP
jgi:hypothetical protein